MAPSWSSGCWSPDELREEPSRDGGGGGDDYDVSAPHERVTSRLRSRGTLEKICNKYSVPDSFTPVLAGNLSSWSPPPPGSVCVYVDSLNVGMRLPLHPFFGTVLNHFGLAPSQLLPNGWRVLAGFVVLSHFAGEEPSLAVFRHFFALCLFPPHRFYSFRGKDNHGLLFARMRNRFARAWKEDFFFLASSAPWPCPVEWGEPSGSSALDQSLTGKEKAMAKKLLRARRSSPIDLTTYLRNNNLAAAKIIGAPSAPPTPRVPTYLLVAEKAAAATRVSVGKVAVKSEPDCEVLPCAPSFGKKRKVSVDGAVDGESSASEPSGPRGFPAPCKPPSATGRDGDWKAARRLLQGTVSPSRERELCRGSKPDSRKGGRYEEARS